MKVLVNYANRAFVRAQKLNSQTGLTVGGFDGILSYGPNDIDPEFYKANKTILTQARGNGYWLWKPYFIKRTLKLIDKGDFLFYCDSGSYFRSSINPLIAICLEVGQDILPFDLSGQTEIAWTKRDALILMKCDEPTYVNTYQRLAGFSLWRKSSFATEFVNEWLGYAQHEQIITDLDNQCGQPNYPEFQEHRHDQSIFSLLTQKYELEVFRDPSQWGNDHAAKYSNSPYGQLIVLTRRTFPSFAQIYRAMHSFGIFRPLDFIYKKSRSA